MRYRLKRIIDQVKYESGSVGAILRGRGNRGYCPICESPVWFIERGSYLRNTYTCNKCASIPRWRALAVVLTQEFPGWKSMQVHESSPGCPLSDKLARECPGYIPTQFIPGVELGTMAQGFRIEDLGHQTFADASFDLVITSDVFEHLPEPKESFQEIARTLKTGGAHIFTVPWYRSAKTQTRARLENGKWVHLMKPDYHMNPVDPEGSLVTTDWGYEMPYLIQEWTGMVTTIHKIKDRSLGIDAELNEVFVSRKMK